MPTECLTCKPGDATFHNAAVANTGCENTYQLVDECMKAHNGRVSACVAEWSVFRKCHERVKAAKAATAAATAATVQTSAPSQHTQQQQQA